MSGAIGSRTSSSSAAAPPAGWRRRRSRKCSPRVRDPPDRVRRDRHRRRRRSDHPASESCSTSCSEIDEIDFVETTKGTFKLGIEFVDWARIGDRYIHGFGTIGHDLGMMPFHQYWLKAFQQGKASELDDYSLCTAAALRGKFMASASDVPPNSPLANIAYAYHFDAGLYAHYPAQLRRSARRAAHRRQGRRRHAAARRRLHRIGDAAERREASPAICSSTAPASAACSSSRR